ncbi:MAG TPA: DUF2065 domain-containing protein [Steroidobacteraceae bacterium]|nr:DUF2065 domain-containing protein [Steroidobacteraceae bacterium]
MGLDWSDLLAALAIVCIIEGVMPFINPPGMKRLLAKLAALEERELRLGGLFSMLIGLAILFLVRS